MPQQAHLDMSRTGPERKPARRIRIAVVTETYPPEINGVARTVGPMVEWLLARGHTIDLVRPRQRGEPVGVSHPALRETLTAGAAVPRSQVQVGFAFPGALAAKWRAGRPDLVHVVTEGPLGWAAVSAARSLGIPVCSDFHTNFHSYSEHYGLAWARGAVEAYLRWIHNRTACTLIPTEQLRVELEHLGIERLRVARRGVDVKLFDPAKRSADLRRQWGCSGNELVAISVGRLAPEKALDQFASVTRAMQAVDPRIRVVVVGDGPVRARLQKRNPDFHFAGARVGEDLAAHYASADVFLFPSVTETFGNVVLEAMASGLALVAYDDAAARQHVIHMENGMIAPRGDAHLLTHLAEMLAHEPAMRLCLGREARSAACEVPWERRFPELEAVLIEAASRPPTSSSPAAARAEALR